MPIEYRFADSGDMEALDRQWEEESGWGTQQLAQWFLAAPFGEPRVVMASDRLTGALLGQFRFMPTQVSVDGHVVRATRPFGTIITKTMREAVRSVNPLRQPAVAMYLFATKALRADGVQLIHMVPDPRWERLLRMFPFFQTGKFRLWSLKLPLSAPLHLPDGYTSGPLPAWDARVDRLWDVASSLHGCSVVRNARTLAWKFSVGTYAITAIERGGELVGVVGSQRKGDRQWLICDLLAADAGDSLRATLTAACQVADEQSVMPGDRPLHKVAVLASPVLEPVVRALGFSPDSYESVIVVHVLDHAIPASAVAPARWYVSAND
ncbi:MAG: hypothetical protein WKG32_19220 [Gemmatimonadaceae bacterium]